MTWKWGGMDIYGELAMDWNLWLTGSGLTVAALVWLIRLEGRINTQDVLTKELKDDISYIRSRIDSALNGHGHWPAGR